MLFNFNILPWNNWSGYAKRDFLLLVLLKKNKLHKSTANFIFYET